MRVTKDNIHQITKNPAVIDLINRCLDDGDMLEISDSNYPIPYASYCCTCNLGIIYTLKQTKKGG